MRLRWLSILVVGAAVIGSTTFVDRVLAPPAFDSGLTTLVRKRVEPGHVVFAGRDSIIYVVDIRGRIVKRWAAPTGHTYSYARPLDDGNMLVSMEETASELRSIVELDQEGNTVWRFDQPDGYKLHHDHSRLPNGHTLMMCSRELVRPAISRKLIEDDCLLEVRRNGTIAWEWQTADHFDEFGFSARKRHLIRQHAGDWAHGNTASALPKNNGHRDARFKAGNIILSYRFINAVIIVDRDTGAIVWKTDGLTIGQHAPEMIPKGYPGAGNILIFDNGLGGLYDIGARPYSRVIEVDPTDMKVISDYRATSSRLPHYYFNSFFISSSQRLANGNTLIVEGAYLWPHLRGDAGGARGVGVHQPRRRRFSRLTGQPSLSRREGAVRLAPVIVGEPRRRINFPYPGAIDRIVDFEHADAVSAAADHKGWIP